MNVLRWTLLLLLTHAYFPAGILTEQITLTPANWEFKTLAWLVAFWLGVHFILVRPLTRHGYGQLETLNAATRILFVGVLFSLPLLSFAYYLGGLPDLRDVAFLILVVFASVTTGMRIYESTQSSHQCSTFIALSVAVPYFLLGPFFSPLPVAFRYLVHTETYYAFRSIFPFTAFIVGVIFYRTLTPSTKKELQ